VWSGGNEVRDSKNNLIQTKNLVEKKNLNRIKKNSISFPPPNRGWWLSRNSRNGNGNGSEIGKNGALNIGLGKS